MISILKNNENLTTFKFYTSFLQEVALYIKENDTIDFKFVEHGDNLVHESSYKIDPITIPLLLSLIEQLSKFYKKPIELSLYNNQATKDVLKFLMSSDFFNISGDNTNPYFPYGRNILHYDKRFLGDFNKRNPRPEHRVRCYSLNDNNLFKKLKEFENRNPEEEGYVAH